jgi:hypothetical protein
MTDIRLSTRQPSLFSTVRTQANAILRGPQNILWAPDVESEPPYYGWSALLLEKMKAAPVDYIEARSVYANLFDNTQQFAVLRAVSWNGETTRKLVREQGQNFKLLMPARFVKLPIERLKTWLSEFNGISITVNIDCIDDDAANIRRLRIKQDHISCIFEKVWQAHQTNHSKLNQKWDQVWTQMTESLITEPSITNLDEDFWFVKLDIAYDFRTYRPDWFDFS